MLSTATSSAPGLPDARLTDYFAHSTIAISHHVTLEDIDALVDAHLDSGVPIAALRIDACFALVFLRTFGPQTPSYPPLASVISNEAVHLIYETAGTIVGSWVPSGHPTKANREYRLHLAGDERPRDGHVVACEFVSGQIALMQHNVATGSSPSSADPSRPS